MRQGCLRRPAVCVPLTSTNRRVRLAWCREYRDWSMDQWATVLFTDESRFSLNTNSRRTFIWRELGTRYLPSNVREIDHYGGGGLMVWAGIMLDGRTPLHVFERGTVTGVRYRDEILEPYVRLFRGAVGPEFILMDDNARPHRALLVDEFLESEDIRRMDSPARSPDLNPIELIWDALGRTIATRNSPPRTIQEVKTALLNEWDQLPQEMINCLISSMKSRCKASISMNPQHCVPTIDDNGFYLWESRAILAYLANKYAPDSPVYPKDPKERAIVDRLLYFDIGTLYKAEGDYLYPQFFKGQPADPEKAEAFKKALDLLEGFLSKTAYVAGDQITLADFPILGSVTFAEAADYSYADYPKITAWMEKLKSEIPSYKEINEGPLLKFKEFLKSRK
ncbi:Glutathione S-transferase 1, isoform C [Araneus ventricosus]|uniref:Glutathione S-transferase 1, isoform C n=1 Tax=Araneus ventricosus TaxID=182803 RepID=A0A4Y2GWK9_ARAVE|nr:Glutathione S-transferase 1, isoform C [Araneus ventricosus]